MMVALAWETHTPLCIAEMINTKYGFRGPFRWTDKHVENARQTIAALDREAEQGG